MSSKTQKKPSIRFKGFTDAWEQRKLGERVTIKSGWSPSNFVRTNSEGSELFIKVDDLNYSSREQNDSQMRVNDNPRFQKMKKGSTIFPKRGAAIMTNKVRILSSDAYMDTNMMALEPQEIDGDFLYTFIDRTGLYKIADTSTIPQINNKHIEPYIIYCPSIEEQTKVGSIFKKLDDTIALHQHQLDNHKELKKALLQKMFPRNGEKLPEVRFGGFTEVWEKRKLNKVMSDFIVPMRDKPKEFSGEIPWTRIEDIEGKYLNDSLSGQYVSQAIIEKMNLKVIPKDSLIVSASATFGVVAIVTQDLITNQTFIGLVPEANFDLDFLYTLFQTPTVRTKMKFESAGSTIFYITRQTFENMQFLLPSYEEQQSIGSFFKNIDDTITLLQQKLNDYQRLKKVMLQQMFV